MTSSAMSDSPDSSTGGLQLKLLGEFGLARADGASVPLPGKRERVLLAYLALHPAKRERRRKLTGILWGDASGETLLDNLRTSVWSLRKALGDTDRTLIVSQDDSIALAPGAFAVDVSEFETLAKRADREALEAAARLYSGELLEGSEINSAEFETWLAGLRMHLRGVATDAYLRLAAILAGAGETDSAIEHLQTALRLDPYHEGVVRQLLSLYVESGRRGAAFETYRALVGKLEADMGAEPEIETRRLYSEISQGNYAATDPQVLHPRAAPVRETRQNAVGTEPANSAAGMPRNRIQRIVVVSAAAVLLLAVPLAFYFQRSPMTEIACDAAGAGASFPLPERPSIAVLTFENLSNDSSQDSFADALTNDITTALSIVSEMFVIDRGSTLAYKGRNVGPQQIATELGVRYILAGTVQRSGGRVRVSTRLVDALSGQQVWAERYDRADQDTFPLQDEITLAVITALQVQLTEGEQERVSRVHGTQNLDAWVISGQALQLLRNFTLQENSRARELYEEALALDPNYPGALDGLAWTYILAARFGWSEDPVRDFGLATELATRAMELDPSRSRSYALDGMLQLTAGNHAAAVRSGERAIELDPNGSEVAALLGLTLSYTGDVDRSADLIARAMRLSPYYPDWYRYALGRARRMQGEYEDAELVLSCFEPAGALQVTTLAELAETYAAWGREADANAVAEELLTVNPAFSARVWVSNPPLSRAELTEAEIRLLRAAGLPE